MDFVTTFAQNKFAMKEKENEELSHEKTKGLIEKIEMLLENKKSENEALLKLLRALNETEHE